MSELDLGLKVGVRRLLWSQGFSTRLDVVLRADASSTGRTRSVETYTDLDVLGVALAPGFQLTRTIADCKSGGRDRPVARAFWARGVADLFNADNVMLVREREVPKAARQLSTRLGMTVVTPPDLQQLQQMHAGDPLTEPDGPLRFLFDRESVARHLSAFNSLDRKLGSLVEYRNFDYWVYDAHENPFQLVAHLKDAKRSLDPSSPPHLALFMDLAWLYLLSLIQAVSHIRRAHLQNPDLALQEYLFGGPLRLREKQDMAELLEAIRPENISVRADYRPPYYSALRELVTRLGRRPDILTTSLRYAEAASTMMSSSMRVPLADIFAEGFDPIAAKLLGDVCGFLVAAGDLDSRFRGESRAYLLAEQIPDPADPRKLPPAKRVERPILPPEETASSSLPDSLPSSAETEPEGDGDPPTQLALPPDD